MSNVNYDELTAMITREIAFNPPVVSYTQSGVEKARRALTPAMLSSLKQKKLLGYDFEKYYVFNRFFQSINLYEKADDEYLSSIFSSAVKYSAKDFKSNPYVKKIKTPTVKIGNFLLTESSYERGEIFQYDMPDTASYPLVPRLGFFTDTVAFSTIYEGNVPWMSVCPSEINSMKDAISRAHGRVLVLGLCLGYYPFMIASRKEVESIVIVELQNEVVELFENHLLPQFPFKEKIRVVCADALRYLACVRQEDFDFCFADIWENQFDGAVYYKEIKPYEALLPKTEFSYWIEKEILWYLSQTE